MKKFKVRNINKKYKIIIFSLIVLILFIIISFSKLTKSHSHLINELLNNFNKRDTSIANRLTNNLDNLINTYVFKDNDYINKPFVIENKTNNEIDNST